MISERARSRLGARRCGISATSSRSLFAAIVLCLYLHIHVLAVINQGSRADQADIVSELRLHNASVFAGKLHSTFLNDAKRWFHQHWSNLSHTPIQDVDLGGKPRDG